MQRGRGENLDSSRLWRPSLQVYAKRIKTTEWGEIEAKVIELFDLTAMHLPTRKVGLSWRYVLERAKRWALPLVWAGRSGQVRTVRSGQVYYSAKI
jgi:hypothetical protein